MLGFELFGGKAHIDLTHKEINQLVTNFSQDLSNLPRFLFVMCHGNANGLLDKNEDLYNKTEVLFRHFSSNDAPHLKEVLKLITIQACR